MSDGWIAALGMVGCLVFAVSVSLWTWGPPWTVERRAREAKERSDAEWLAKVEEWNR